MGPEQMGATAWLAQIFEASYRKAPRWIARAPGRVNLIGEHTDYNDGYVLPMAIERDTTILAAPNSTTTMRWKTTAMDDVVTIDLGEAVEAGPRGHWSNYPRGVVAGFLKTGRTLPGFDALVHTTVPIGGGLSSSAALEVATATLVEAMLGERLDPVAKALLCQAAENDYAGVPCGIMDQFVSTLGQADHLLLLDCRSRQAQQIAFADPSLSVLIINSNIKHDLANSQYAVRRQQCAVAAKALNTPSLRDVTPEQLDTARGKLDPVIFGRARHVIGEIERTTKMAERIRSQDWLGAGQLMYMSHSSLQHDYEVSCAELDAIVETVQNIGPKGGVYGCRMTGGGFGGCAVALIQTAAEYSVTRTLSEEYARFTGIAPTIFSSRPARGASLFQ